MTITIEQLQDRLEGATGHTRLKHGGPGFQAHCPAHEDHNASLSVDPGDRAIMLYCHVGCTPEQICAALGLTLTDLFYENHTRGGGGKYPPKQQRNTATPEGCTLEQYAKAKRLPEAFLRSLGLSEITYQRAPAVRVPYFAPNKRDLLSTQFRTGLHKPADGPDTRFKFKSGDKAVPYGQWKLDDARAAGHVTLVEGASDCHTLWHHGEPALGFPGATSWKDERDAPLLDGIETIYLVIEPDTGGVAVRKWLAKSPIRDRVRLVELDAATKDASALHLACEADHAQFMTHWQAALDAAVLWSEQEQAETAERQARMEGVRHARQRAGHPDHVRRHTGGGWRRW